MPTDLSSLRTFNEVAAEADQCRNSMAAAAVWRRYAGEQGQEIARLLMLVHRPTPISYTLPDGTPVDVTGWPIQGREAAGTDQVRCTVTDGPNKGATVEIARDRLVEIREPSIDDPEPLPLAMAGRDGGHWVRLVATEGSSDITTIIAGYRDASWSADLHADDLRRLARAAWHRANEIED